MRNRRTALGIGLLLLLCGFIRFVLFRWRCRAWERRRWTQGRRKCLWKVAKRRRRRSCRAWYLQGKSFRGTGLLEPFTFRWIWMRERGRTASLRLAEGGARIYLLDNPLEDDKQEAIRQGKSYRLLAVKGDQYREYAVVFTGLPILTLDTDSGAEIRYEEIYGSMRFYEADSKKDWVTESVMSGHIRGGSSRLNPKKSYKITLYKQNQTGMGALRENHKSFLGMREDDEWLLYAMYSEDTKVRDKLSLDVWNESEALEIDSEGFYGYHMEYIEVFQNGEYYGIYGLMEPVDYKQLKLTKENGAQPEEYLYKQKDPGVFELKGNWTAQNEEDFEALNTYLWYLDAEDEVFAEKMPQLIDVDNALDVWLYLQAVIGMDNIERNIFYPTVWEDGQYRIRFMPWDMDYSWGNVHDF